MMTRDDLRHLMRDIASAAAEQVRAEPSQMECHTYADEPTFPGRLTRTVVLSASVGEWFCKGGVVGASADTAPAFAVLELRERMERQRDERARLLRADEAALQVIDQTARIYDAELLCEAAGGNADRANAMRRWLDGRGPWSREEAQVAVTVVRCNAWDVMSEADAIIRRRARPTNDDPAASGAVGLAGGTEIDAPVVHRETPADAVDDAGLVDAAGSGLEHALSDALAPGAAENAFDAIAKACGCERWEYPGQVVRDVLRVVSQRDALLAEAARRANCSTTHSASADTEEVRLRKELDELRAAVRAHFDADNAFDAEDACNKLLALVAE